MSEKTGKMDEERFEENILRLRLAANMLKAFAGEGGHSRNATAEAREIARFLKHELPAVMKEHETLLQRAIGRQERSGYAKTAALDMIREDRERIIQLAGQVARALRGPGGRRREVNDETFRRDVAAFLAAERHYLDWSMQLYYGGERDLSRKG